jgi:hypothetical protein
MLEGIELWTNLAPECTGDADVKLDRSPEFVTLNEAISFDSSGLPVRVIIIKPTLEEHIRPSVSLVIYQGRDDFGIKRYTEIDIAVNNCNNCAEEDAILTEEVDQCS